MQQIPTEQQPTPQQHTVYPPQSPMYPPPQQPPRSHKRLWLILGIVAAILLVGGIIGGIAGTQGQTTTTPAAQPTQQATTPPSQPTPTQSTPTPTVTPHFTVGQTVQMGTVRQGDIWEITLTSAKTGGSESYLKSGHVFLNILVRVKNISTTEQHISQFDFELRDLEGQRQEVTYDPNAEPSLSGTVEAGSPLKGTLTFEVPSSVHQFELFFTMIGVSGQTIWDISV